MRGLVEERRYHRYRCGRHARDPGGVPQRRGLQLGEALHHLPRETGDASELKAFRDWPPLLPAMAVDVRALAAEVALVFEVSFDAGDVKRRILRVQLQLDLTFGHERLQTDVGLSKRAWRRDLDSADRDPRCFDYRVISRETPLPLFEPRPSLVIHEPDVAAARSEAQVRVVYAQEQAVLRP